MNTLAGIFTSHGFLQGAIIPGADNCDVFAHDHSCIINVKSGLNVGVCTTGLNANAEAFIPFQLFDDQNRNESVPIPPSMKF